MGGRILLIENAELEECLRVLYAKLQLACSTASINETAALLSCDRSMFEGLTIPGATLVSAQAERQVTASAPTVVT